jgi:glyoxylase-like metal-dependent hydrolase (beta-lactamase superfamily II)
MSAGAGRLGRWPASRYTARRGGSDPAVTDIARLEAGALTCRNAAIIHLPGHTPGSVAIHVPAVDALFAGDAMTTRSVLTGETGPRLAPFTLAPAEALSSLELLDGIEAGWLLPGHGPAWTGGVSEALRQVRGRAAAAGVAAGERAEEQEIAAGAW